ncbi:VOC family protein [Aeromicrobium panaciterrae]|uniref:VOC family protein n=1 Tax=Aeromicrobium panaciterrae TaxID=363861 RepID=UPI0031DD5BAE
MTNEWSGVTIDCVDPHRLAAFWSGLLDIPISDEHGDDPGWATVGTRNDALPRLTFQRVPEPRTEKVRLHLDISTDDITTGIAQVEELGGSFTGERHDYDEGIVCVMKDPEGHEFCLVEYF